jgi:Toprim domain
MTALDRFRDALTAHNCRPTSTAAKCPAHDDKKPSLSFGPAKDFDGVVVNCQTGCSLDDILTELGLAIGDLFDNPRQSQQGKAIVAEYPYVDEQGATLYVKVRYWPKGFAQYQPLPNGEKQWKLDGVRRVLFNLPKVLDTKNQGYCIYLAEGEDDALALEQMGATATTWAEGAWRPGGRAKWRSTYSQTLTGAHMIIVRDRDDAGRHTASEIASLLKPYAASVKIVEPAEGKDARDHLNAGLGDDELVPVDDDEPPPQAAPAPAPAPAHQPIKLEQAHEVFKRWLGDDYDIGTLDAMLAAAAVERLDGDPLWLLIVSGSGNTKTETVVTLSSIGAKVVSAVSSEGALLSATSKRDRSKSATGGLLREIGHHACW